MKKPLALLLLFGIVGCETPSNAPSEQWRINNDNNYNQNKKIKTLNVIANTPIISRIDSYDSLEAPIGTKLYKVETRNIETGERVSFQSTQSYDYKNNVYPFVNVLAISRCEKLTKSECVVLKSNDFRVVGEEIRYSNIKEVRDEYSIVFANRARAEIENQKKSTVIHALKERCISYGFTGDNNIAACIQREAKHDYEIEQKEYQLQLAQQQTYAQQNKKQEAPETPWYLFILEAVAEGVEEGYNCRLFLCDYLRNNFKLGKYSQEKH